jgi:hypothetical protein
MPGDKELIGLYKSTGTGTGSGISIGTGSGEVGVPLDETEVVESKQALRGLAIGAGLTVVVALGQFAEAVAPHLAEVVMSYLPQVPFLSAQVLAGLILGGAAWMQKRAAGKHKVAVMKALVTDPSNEMKEAYQESKKGA